MHNARVNTSQRLQRVLAVLQTGTPKTTLELMMEAGVCAVNSCISELRACGYLITCRRDGPVWRYHLLGPFSNEAHGAQ